MFISLRKVLERACRVSVPLALPSLRPSRSIVNSNHTKVDSLCGFSFSGRMLTKVTIYEEFLRMTQNGTRLQNFTLDRHSVLVDGKVLWSLRGLGWNLPHCTPSQATWRPSDESTWTLEAGCVILSGP